MATARRHKPPRAGMVVLVRTVVRGERKWRPGIVLRPKPDGRALVLPGTTQNEDDYNCSDHICFSATPEDAPEMRLHEPTQFYCSRIRMFDAEDIGDEIGYCDPVTMIAVVHPNLSEYMNTQAARLGSSVPPAAT